MGVYFRQALIALICFASVADAQVLSGPTSSNLAYRLEYATRAASANHDCRSSRQKRYAAEFTRRYGERIRRLRQVHEAKSGPDPAFDILADCFRSTASPKQQNKRHREAMDAFEATLRDLEREFGGY